MTAKSNFEMLWGKSGSKGSGQPSSRQRLKCSRKKPFPTSRDALRYANYLNQNGGRTQGYQQGAYWCRVCEFYHVGQSEEKAKNGS